MSKISWSLPLKTVSEGNSSEHWTKSSKRHRQQQFFVRHLFKTLKEPINLPCVVRLTRLASRSLDEGDNLPMSFKFIRDEISECLIPEKTSTYLTKKGKLKKVKGRADDDKRITWQYAQEKCKIQGVRIEICFGDRIHDQLTNV